MSQAISIELILKSMGATLELRKFIGEATHSFQDLALGLAGKLGLAVGLEQAVERMLHLGEASLDNAIKLDRLAQVAAVTTQEMAGFAFAADISGIGSDGLAKSLRGLTDWMSKTGQAGKEIKEVFLEQVDVFSKMENGAVKDQLAIERFGRAGLQMIPFLNRGRDAIQELIDKGELYSNATHDLAMTSEQWEEATKGLKLSLESLAGSLGALVIPALTKTADAFANLFAIARQGIDYFKSGGVNTLMSAIANLTGSVSKSLVSGLAPTDTSINKSQYEQSRKEYDQQIALSKLMMDLANQDKNISPTLRQGNINAEITTQIGLMEKLANLVQLAQRSGIISKDEANTLAMEYSIKAKTLQEKLQPVGMLDSMSAEIKKMVAEWGTASKQIADTFKGVINDAIAGISHGITGLITGTTTWGQALKQIGTSILNTVIEGIVRMFAAWILGEETKTAVVIAGHVAEGAAELGKLAMVLPMALIHALATAIGEGGWGAIAIIAAAVAALGVGVAAASGAFESGGYTGSGSVKDVAGVVHRKEFVFSAPAVDRIGVSNLEALHRGDSMSGGANVNLAIFNDEQDIPGWAKSNNGETHIVNVVRKNWHRVQG